MGGAKLGPMSLEKYDPDRDLKDLFLLRNDIERLTSLAASEDAVTPRLDLFDWGDSYRVIIEVPGVEQENLEVALEGRSLTVAGLREPSGDDAMRLISERPSGHFQRTLELPEAIDPEGTRANLQHALLILTLPKA